MARRSRAREVVLQLACELDRNPDVPGQRAGAFIRERLRDEELRQFAAELLAGIRTNRQQLDTVVQAVTENWKIDRITPVDRSILRLGAYELLFCPQVPPKVAINEAVELAKRYGTADSPRFVNGILDRVLKQRASPCTGQAEERGGPDQTSHPGQISTSAS